MTFFLCLSPDGAIRRLLRIVMGSKFMWDRLIGSALASVEVNSTTSVVYVTPLTRISHNPCHALLTPPADHN